MTEAFDGMTPVLDYKPDSRPLRYAQGGRRGLLWPALVYKVVAPVRRERPFNLFQEHVLKLCQGGVTSAMDIGRRLAFGEELAAFILAQLQSLGLLDDRDQPTRRAVKELEELALDTTEPTVGHVFQDPFRGDLLPRFLPGPLKRVLVQDSFRDMQTKVLTFRYELGTPGNPVPVKATAVEPLRGWEERLQPPSAQRILAAWRAHCKQQRNHERACGRVENGANRDLPAAVDQVFPVSKEPQPVFLNTVLFVPENIQQASLWQVCDPFGLGPSAALRQRIEELLDKPAGRALGFVLEEVAGSSYRVNPVDLAELVAEQHRVAVGAVERRLAPEIRKYLELLNRLVEVEEALAEVRPHAESAGTGYQLRQGALKDFFGRVHAALEELCEIVLRQNPPGGTLAALSGMPEQNASLLAQLADRIGFRDDADEPCFPDVFHLGRNNAQGVVQFGRRGLWSQFCVLVTAALDLAGHPLNRLAASFPDGVVFLFKVKRYRDSSVHATGTELTGQIDPMIEGLYRWVRLLLPGMDHLEADKIDSTAMGQQSQLAHKLRAGASFTVEKRLGLRIREWPAIQGPLVEMQARVEELRHLSAETVEPRGKLISFMVKGCIAVEASLKALLFSHSRPDEDVSLPGDKHRNAPVFTEVAREVGFTINGDDLPEALVKVNPRKVAKALRHGNESINPLTLALLLAAREVEDHPLRALAKSRPRFLLEVAELSDRRGHGDDVRIRLDEVDSVAEQVFGLIDGILQISS